MYRQLVLSTGALSMTQQTTASGQLTRSLSSRTNTHNRKGSGEISSIREWLASFTENVEAVLSSIIKTKHDPSAHGMSRSSKKLICRAPIDALRQRVPEKVIERVKDSSHYVRGSDAVVTSSDKGLSTSANRQDCMKKIYDILRDTAKDIITEASREPPKPLCKRPGGSFSSAGAKKRYDQRKELQRAAKVDERSACAREEKRKPRGPRN